MFRNTPLTHAGNAIEALSNLQASNRNVIKWFKFFRY